MRSRSMVAVCSSSGLATATVTRIAAEAPVTMREARWTRRSIASAGDHDATATALALRVARRPRGDGEPVEVEQRLVGHVDRERRREAGGHHRAEDQQRPRDAGVPAHEGRHGAAREDGETRPRSTRRQLVGLDRHRAADPGHDGGSDARGTEDRRAAGGRPARGGPRTLRRRRRPAQPRHVAGCGGRRAARRRASRRRRIPTATVRTISSPARRGVPGGEDGDERGDGRRSARRARGSRARSWRPAAASPDAGGARPASRRATSPGWTPALAERERGVEPLAERGLQQRDAGHTRGQSGLRGLLGVLAGDVDRGGARRAPRGRARRPAPWMLSAMVAPALGWASRRPTRIPPSRCPGASRRAGYCTAGAPSSVRLAGCSGTPTIGATSSGRQRGMREHDTARRPEARRTGDAGRPDRAAAAAGAAGRRGRRWRADERHPDARQPRLDRARRDDGRRQQEPQLPRGGHVPLRHARLHHRPDRPAA